MNRSTKRWLLLIVVMTIAFGAIALLTRSKPVEVVLHRVGMGEVEATVTNTRAGTVKACRRAHLSPAVGGPVAQVHVSKGQRIKRGQTLISLWNDDLSAQVILTQQELAASRTRAKEACLVADQAKRESDRVVRLRQQNLVSEEQVDQSVTVSQARSVSCETARAAVEVSKAQVAVAKASRQRTLLSAPFGGIVAEINTEVGEYITPSPPGIPTLPAIDLIDASCLYVSAPIDEVDAPAIRTGMPAYVTLDALPNQRLDGEVRRIAPYVLDREKQARTVEVEVEITDVEPVANLLAGYSADIEVVLQKRAGVVRVPAEAVLGGNRVLLLDPATGTLVERTLEPGLRNWSFVEVKSGLTPGDQIVLSLDREEVVAGAKARGSSTAP